MKILFVTSECAPFSKSGGLADVAFSLPPALRKEGNEVAIITPLYDCVRKFSGELSKAKDCRVRHGQTIYDCALYRGDRDGVTVWFVEYDPFFARPRLYGYDDDKLRFAFFSRAVIELLPELDFVPEILHCNDWETALAVVYLKNDQAWRKDLQGIKSVYTIHNMAYQGQFGVQELTTTFALPYGWYQGGLAYEFEGRHDVNLMKGAMLAADAVSTVSPTYARELHYPQFAHGLQGVVDLVDNKLRGILNGIDMDHYDPRLDQRLPYAFSVEHMEGKAKCKASIQRKFGLEVEPEYPLFCSVARLVEQKGIELIRQILPQLMDLGIQLIIFGQGEQKYVDFFHECRMRYPGQLGFSDDYSEAVAAEVFAGADFYLMPSRFEPCGLSQMMAMRYGTVPIVHETGGLKDSVRPYSRFDGVGDGFSFSNYQGTDLYLAILEAAKVFFADQETFGALRRRCMKKDFSWTKSSQEYLRMYSDIYTKTSGATLSYPEGFDLLKAAYEKLDGENRKKYSGRFTDHYHRILNLHCTGRMNGIVSVEFRRDEQGTFFDIQPNIRREADATVKTDFDYFLGMAQGTISFDKLFLNGLLTVEGNLAKGVQIRQLLNRLSRD
ncbi:MAG: glycosyltransferase [Ruminococcaceae bacterium]|nr:glycosyltransferase [Oscillospiraceae bacterium]